MAGLTLDVVGLNETIAKIKALGKAKEAEVAKEIKSTAEEIRKDAATSAPVDMGNLRKSIRVGRVTNLSAEVRSDADYSPYIEFGTGTGVNVPNLPDGLQQYAMQFKGKGIRQVNLPARPFFFPAAIKNYKLMIERLKKLLVK